MPPETNPPKASTAEFTYTFAGWDKQIPASITDNISFVPTYTQTVRQYTYTFLDENGEVLKSQTLDYGSPIVPPAQDPTKDSTDGHTYVFVGWDKDIPATLTEDIVFTAEFSSTTKVYTYIFYDDDGTEILKETKPYGSPIVPPATDPTKSEDDEYTYTFAGWDKPIPNTLTADIEFTAVYTPTQKIYNISFNAMGGDAVDDIAAAIGSAVIPPVTQKDYYDFVGWYESGSDEAFDFSSMPARNVNLYARWEIMEGYCEVIVVNGIGSGIYPQGTIIVIGEPEVPEGYFFVKWQMNGEDFTHYMHFYYTVTENIFAEAIFEAEDVNLLPAAGQNGPAYLLELAADYPKEESRIASGYAALYMGNAGKSLLAIYPDDTFIYERYDPDYKELVFIWGFMLDGGYISEWYAIIGTDYKLSEVVSEDFLYQEVDGIEIVFGDTAIVTGYYVFVNTELLDVELYGEDGQYIIFCEILSNPVYCPVGGDVSDINFLIEGELILSDTEEFDYSEFCALVTEDRYLIGYYNYLMPESVVTGFDSSQAGEGTIEFRGHEVTIIYFELDNVPFLNYMLVTSSNTLCFRQGEEFSGKKLYVNGIYLQEIYCDWSIREVYITEDMVRGFSTETLGIYTMTIVFGDKVISYDYYVIPADADDDDPVYIGGGEMYYYAEDNFLGYIYIMNANGTGRTIVDEVYDEEYQIDLYEAISSGDLVVPPYASFLLGWQIVTITYKGLAGEIYLYNYDSGNPQLYISASIENDNDAICINTEGEISLLRNLQSLFGLDNYSETYGYDVPPPLWIFVGLDLTKIGRQLVKFYDCYDTVYEIYVIVYEGELSELRGYELFAPEVVPMGSNPQVTVRYYLNETYYWDDEVMAVETIDLDNLDTSTPGWKKVEIYLSRIYLTVEIWIYVYQSPSEIMRVDLCRAPYIYAEGATTEDIFDKITLLLTYVDGSKEVISALDLNPELMAYVHYEGYIEIEILWDPILNPDEIHSITSLTIAQSTGDPLILNFSGEGWTAYAGDYNAQNLVTELIIPAEHMGLPVTAMDTIGAPSYTIRRLVIPETMVTIYETAFTGLNVLREIIFYSSTPANNLMDACNLANLYQSLVFFFVPDDAVDAYKAAMFNYADRIFGISEREDFMVDENGVLFAYLGNDYEVVIPSVSANGITVTEIAKNAFYNSSILKVVIPNTVRAIKNSAFRERGLYYVEFEEGSQLECIEDYAFYYNFFFEIVLPASLKEIGSLAFGSCYKLERVILSAGIERIMSFAFSYSGLKEINLPSTLEYLGYEAFYCTDIEWMGKEDHCYYVDGWLAEYYSYEELDEFKVKDGTIGIAAGAFCYAEGTVVVNAEVQRVNEEAFGSKIYSVTFLGAVPPVFDANVFLYSAVIIYVPEDSLDAYIAALGEGYNILAIGS